MAVDAVVPPQRDHVQVSAAMQREHPLNREVGNGRIFVDEHWLQVAVEPLQRLVAEVREPPNASRG